MTTRSPTAKGIEVPDLVAVKADQAISTLRDLGLMPVTWSAAVDDVKDAGYVLGLEPPAGTTVRAKTLITLSVATHPDFQGHDVDLDLQPDRPMQPPLAWPLSAPTGFASPDSKTASEPLTVAFPGTAAADSVPAPASPSSRAAFGDFPHDDAGASVDALTAGAAADLYLDDVSAPVPTPDQLAADAEWDRLRATEAARHAAQRPSTATAIAETAPEPTVLSGEPDAPLERERASEDQARRDARRRSARRYRRLTGKQKALIGAVLALTLLLIVAAVSGHKPAAHQAAHTVARRGARPARKPTTPAVLPQTPTSVPPRRVVRVRTRTRVVTVTVTTPSPHPRPSHSSSHTTAATGASSYTPPVSTHTGETPAVTPSVTDNHTAPTSSPQPSAPASAHPTSGGTGGGSTLQSPDGATAPPQP